MYFAPASQKLILQIAQSGKATLSYEVMTGVTRNTDIRIQIGRNGNTEWVYSAGNGPVNRVSVPQTVTFSSALVVGGGLTPATFPTLNTQMSCPGILLRDQLCLWHRCPSDTEITSKIKAGAYPWGRGT